MGFGADESAGVPAQQIWENQRKGWDGYGWTDQKIKALGRNPEARELSPGGQAAWNWRNNELLLKGLLDASAQAEKHYPSGPQQSYVNERGLIETPQADLEQVYLNPNTGMPVEQERAKNSEEMRRLAIDSALSDYRQNRDQTHGESGYLGATQNQEYLAGLGLSLLDTIPQAAWSAQVLTPSDKSGISTVSGMGLASNLAHAGRWAWNFGTQALPEAADQRDIRKYGFAVEPVLPAGYAPSEGTKVLRDALLADAPSYDLWYRAAGPGKKDQSWPTYAGSTAATFANGLLDPSSFATGPARGIVQRLGLNLLRAGRSPSLYGKMARNVTYGLNRALPGGQFGPGLKPMMYGSGAWLPAPPAAKMLGGVMRGYGSRLAKDAADATFWPVVRPGLSEAADEVPTNAGLSAFFYGTSGNTAGPPQPGPGDWFSSKGRTDKYVQDTETGQWREPTQQEVEGQYAEAMAKYQAGRKSRHAVVEQIKKSLLP
jgi:hypothetical protein